MTVLFSNPGAGRGYLKPRVLAWAYFVFPDLPLTSTLTSRTHTDTRTPTYIHTHPHTHTHTSLFADNLVNLAVIVMIIMFCLLPNCTFLTCTISYICFTANTKQVCKVLVLLVLFAVSSELQIQNKSATYSSYFLHLLHCQFKQVCKCHPPKWYKRRCKLWIEHQFLSSPLD